MGCLQESDDRKHGTSLVEFGVCVACLVLAWAIWLDSCFALRSRLRRGLFGVSRSCVQLFLLRFACCLRWLFFLIYAAFCRMCCDCFWRCSRRRSRFVKHRSMEGWERGRAGCKEGIACPTRHAWMYECVMDDMLVPWLVCPLCALCVPWPVWPACMVRVPCVYHGLLCASSRDQDPPMRCCVPAGGAFSRLRLAPMAR